jgi:TM2 domain-containing membrane protein YozV
MVRLDPARCAGGVAAAPYALPVRSPVVRHTSRRRPMPGQGSTGNVIAALCSFFIPGLGQLLQGRLLIAVVQFVLAGFLWFFLLGWVIHLWSILDAALWKPKQLPAP